MWTDAKKLEMIAYVVDEQTKAQNDESGDGYKADAYLAMEVIDLILAGDESCRTNGAFRTYFEDQR